MNSSQAYECLLDNSNDLLSRTLLSAVEQVVAWSTQPAHSHSLKDVEELSSLLASVKGKYGFFDSSLSQHHLDAGVALLVLEVTKAVHQILLKLSLDLIIRLSPDLEYWQSRHNEPLTCFVEQGPLHLMRNHPLKRMMCSPALWSHTVSEHYRAVLHRERAEVSRKMTSLRTFQQDLVQLCGELSRNLHHLSLPAVHVFHAGHELSPFTELLTRMSSHVLHKSTQLANGKHLSTQDGLNLLDETVKGIPNFFQELDNFVVSVKRPSHLTRHWLFYSGVAGTCAITGYGVFTHWQGVCGHVRHLGSAAWAFLHEHLVVPVGAIYHRVFDVLQRRTVVTSQEGLEQSKLSLSRMLQSFATEHQLDTVENVQRRSQDGDMSLVMNKYERDLLTSTKQSLLFGSMTQNMLIQVQKLKVDMESALLELEQLLDANEINFQLMAAVPVLLVSIPLCFTAHSVITRKSFDRFRTSSHRKTMHLCLRDVDLMLVRQMNKEQAASVASGVAPVGVESDAEHGNMLVCLHRALMAAKRLRKVGLISSEQMDMIRHDTRLLEGFELQSFQKLLVLRSSLRRVASV